jgi:hypothetical protein
MLRRANITVTEWAAGHPPYTRETVKGWYAKDGRRIPRAAADTIAVEFPDVPATARIWKNGIREPPAE